MGINCKARRRPRSKTKIPSRPLLSVDFIHTSGVKTQDPRLKTQDSRRWGGGGKRGQVDPAQSHSGLSRCPSTHPLMAKKPSQTARGAGRDARLLQRRVAEVAHR